LGIPTIFAGVGIGLVIGSIKIMIPINGDVGSCQKNKKKLSRFSLN
jgi:hypothetical protein